MTSGGTARARVVAEALVAGAAVGLFGVAWWLRVEWLERRFGLETGHAYFLTIERAILVGVGVALLLAARPRVGRWAERVGGGEVVATCFRFAVAFVLAIVASEVGLRILKLPRRYDM